MVGLNGHADPVLSRHLDGLSRRVREMALADKAKGHQVFFIEAAGSGRVRISIGLDAWRMMYAMQPHCPHPIKLLGSVPNKQHSIEKIHGMFAAGRVHGDWFVMSDGIQQFVSQHGVQT